MSFIRQWPLYGSTIFDVLQGYSTTLPKNLWLAVNQYGVHILKRREKEPLVSYEYKDIVNYRYGIVVYIAMKLRSTVLNGLFMNLLLERYTCKSHAP